MARIAIIGAGLAGLVVARRLRDRHAVTVFEKSRGVGGRMATRYADGFEFDHGAQFFTARTPAFRRFLEPLIRSGTVGTWHGRFAELQRSEISARRQWDEGYPHYVGVPRMNAIGKHLADALDVRLETRIVGMQRSRAGWDLEDSSGKVHGGFEWVIVTAPALQTAALVPAVSPLRPSADAADMRACYALMLGFAAAPGLPWDAALVRAADVSWISVNSSKPGRPEGPALVVHSTNAWADAHIDADREFVLTHLLQESSAVTGINLSCAGHVGLQRWRFANIAKQQGPAFALDPGRGLAACGDWFLRGRVEAAFTSAIRLARRLEEEFGD